MSREPCAAITLAPMITPSTSEAENLPPCRFAIVVRSAGTFFRAIAAGPSPFAFFPWQETQYALNVSTPSIDWMRGAGAFLIVWACAVPAAASIRKPAGPNTIHRLACVIVTLLLGETDGGTTDEIRAVLFRWQIASVRTPGFARCRVSGTAREQLCRHTSKLSLCRAVESPRMADLTGLEAARLAAIVESSDDAIISKDLNGIVTSWNQSAERIFGFTADEMIGQSIRRILPADRQTEEDVVVARVRSGEKVDHFETVRQRKDGTLVPISLTVSPIHDDNGVVVGASKIARDIRDRKRLAGIVESSDDAIISKTLKGIVTSWNPASERMFGYTAEEMIGQSIRRIIPADRQTEEDHVVYRLRRGEKVEHFETIRQRKDGSMIPISLTVSPNHDDRGYVVGASKIARDIRDRREAEAERARLLTAAQQASQLKDEFLATLSHELRT